MDTLGQIWKRRARLKNLREEKKNKNTVLEDIKGIFIDVLNIEVDEKKPILDQLVEIVHKYNEEVNGKDFFLQRAKRKFENKVLEKVAQKIAIDQVGLSTILVALKDSINNVVT